MSQESFEKVERRIKNEYASWFWDNAGGNDLEKDPRRDKYRLWFCLMGMRDSHGRPALRPSE